MPSRRCCWTVEPAPRRGRAAARFARRARSRRAASTSGRQRGDPLVRVAARGERPSTRSPQRAAARGAAARRGLERGGDGGHPLGQRRLLLAGRRRDARRRRPTRPRWRSSSARASASRAAAGHARRAPRRPRRRPPRPRRRARRVGTGRPPAVVRPASGRRGAVLGALGGARSAASASRCSGSTAARPAGGVEAAAVVACALGGARPSARSSARAASSRAALGACGARAASSVGAGGGLGRAGRGGQVSASREPSGGLGGLAVGPPAQRAVVGGRAARSWTSQASGSGDVGGLADPADEVGDPLVGGVVLAAQLAAGARAASARPARSGRCGRAAGAAGAARRSVARRNAWNRPCGSIATWVNWVRVMPEQPRDEVAGLVEPAGERAPLAVDRARRR